MLRIFFAFAVVFSCKSPQIQEGRSNILSNPTIGDGIIAGGPREPKAGIPNLTVGNAIFGGVEISMMVLLKDGDTDLFNYQLETTNGKVVKSDTTPLDSIVFWDVKTGNYLLKARGCQRDRIDLRALYCSDYTPPQAVTIVNQLTKSQKDLFAKIDQVNKETLLIATAAHSIILSYLKDAKYPKADSNPNLQNAFNLALLGPDQASNLLSKAGIVDSLQNNMPNPQNPQNSQNPSKSPNQGKPISGSAPTILISVGSIGFLISAIVLTGTVTLEHQIINSGKSFDKMIERITGNQNVKVSTPDKIKEYIDKKTIEGERFFIGQGIAMTPTLWNKFVVNEADLAQLKQEITAEVTMLTDDKKARTYAEKEIYKAKQIAFIKQMTRSLGGESVDLSRYQTDVDYRDTVLNKLRIEVNRSLVEIDLSEEAFLKYEDPKLKALVKRDVVRANFLSYQRERINIESQLYQDYIFHSSVLRGLDEEMGRLKREREVLEKRRAQAEGYRAAVAAIQNNDLNHFRHPATPIDTMLADMLADLHAHYVRKKSQLTNRQAFTNDPEIEVQKRELDTKIAFVQARQGTRPIRYNDLGPYLAEYDGVVATDLDETKHSLAANEKHQRSLTTVEGKAHADSTQKLGVLKQNIMHARGGQDIPDSEIEKIAKDEFTKFASEQQNLLERIDTIKENYMTEEGRTNAERFVRGLLDKARLAMGDVTSSGAKTMVGTINDVMRGPIEQVSAELRFRLGGRIAEAVGPSWWNRRAGNWAGASAQPLFNEMAKKLESLTAIQSPELFANMLRTQMDEFLQLHSKRYTASAIFETISRPEDKHHFKTQLKDQRNKAIDFLDEKVTDAKGSLTNVRRAFIGTTLASVILIGVGVGISESQAALAQGMPTLDQDLATGVLAHLNLSLIANLNQKSRLFTSLTLQSNP